ncbi:DMT family transporter [Tumidithrix helvetica PCC 7403]|uniref:DMT family transporter n=1 Tax=Tumidithrix helvetica TaxID=3457545 RepID=UPI003CC2C0E5
MPLHQSSGRWRLGLGLSLLTVFLWGFLAVVLKIVLQVLDAYTVTWFRFLFAFLCLGIYLATKQELPKLRQLGLPFLGLLAIATLCLATNYILFLLGLEQTSPNNAQILIQLAPVLLGFGSLWLFKERYNRQQWVGVTVLILGMVLFSHEQIRTLVTTLDSYLWGNFLLVVAAIAWAIYGLAQKQLLQKLPSASVMLCVYGGSSLLFAPLASPARLLAIEPLYMGLLLFCALNTLIAYGAFAAALEHWDASRVSAVLTLTPLVTLGASEAVTLFFPALLATRTLTITALCGAILVVAGSLAISLGGSSRKK